MKRNRLVAMLVLFVGAAVCVVFVRPHRVIVENHGAGVVEVIARNSEYKTLLGEGGTGYFSGAASLRIGDARVDVDQRIKVLNTGTSDLRIVYRNAEGTKQAMILGEGGTGYFDMRSSFEIGDVAIRVGAR